MRRFATSLVATLAATGLAASPGTAQTPEQTQLWDQQRAQAHSAGLAKSELQARERAARKADPMAWVNTLDPMLAGGWEFRVVAADGSWAAFATRHQMKRAGSLVTVWLRQEYAEAQTGGSGNYSSVVEKVQYDCTKEHARPLVVIYYAANNMQGSEQTEETDLKTSNWNAIVPGTRDEANFLWACNTGKQGS